MTRQMTTEVSLHTPDSIPCPLHLSPIFILTLIQALASQGVGPICFHIPFSSARNTR